MASETDRVAAALNRITDAVFLDALSTNDRTAMADFVADFFCGENTDNSDSEEEEEPGTGSYYNSILRDSKQSMPWPFLMQ